MERMRKDIEGQPEKDCKTTIEMCVFGSEGNVAWREGMTKGKGERTSEGMAVQGRCRVRRSVGTQGTQGGQGPCIQKALPASPTLLFSNLGEIKFTEGAREQCSPPCPPLSQILIHLVWVWRRDLYFQQVSRWCWSRDLISTTTTSFFLHPAISYLSLRIPLLN